MRRPVAVVTLLILFLPVPAGTAQGPEAAPHLRLYGCGDDLGTVEDRPTLGPDGVVDCRGDAVRLPAAWLSGAGDPLLRAALPTHDQRVDLTLTYHPTYWAPAPGTTPDASAQLAVPGAPTEGLFDTTGGPRPGAVDRRHVSDEEIDPALDPDGDADALDRLPYDGLVDHHERNDGRFPEADLYFPALETRYDLTWWRDGADPTPLPGGASFVLPGLAAVPGVDQPDAWPPDAAPPRMHWYGTPLGLGTLDDGMGALVSPPLVLAPGSATRFLDHQLRVDRLVQDGDGTAVQVDIERTASGVPTPIAHDLLLDTNRTGQRLATVHDAGQDARNVAFADGRHANVGVQGRTEGTSDDAWFVLVESIDDSGPSPRITVRLGRLVSAEAPLNLVLADGGLYRITRLVEDREGLRTLAWSRVLPLEDAFRFRTIGVGIVGLPPGASVPLLPPFDRDHLRLEDLRPHVERDVYGFLREPPGGNGVIATHQLALAPGADRPADRARKTGPVDLSWVERGQEVRLGQTHVLGDGSLTRSLVAPFRYLALQHGGNPLLVHSALFDDVDLVQGATASPASPRAARSFVFDPADPFLPYVSDGLHLYGGTRAEPNAADVLRVSTGIVRPPEHIGQTRLPGALAAARIDLDVRYQPYHIYQVTGKGLLPISDESIDRGIDADAAPHIIDARRDALGDNLYDVAPRNNDPRLADIYGPIVEMRYTGRLLDPGTFGAIDAPFDPNTRIFLPAADRDSERPGLDSADLNGDGNDEGIIPVGFWDRDAGGASHWAREGQLDPERDLVWLQSPLVEVALGADARFFDHGIRYATFDGASRGTGTFEVLDLRAPWRDGQIPVRARAPNVGGNDAGCIAVPRGGEPDGAQTPCEGLRAADVVQPYRIRDDHVLWWVEVVDLGAASASVRMNRVFAPDAMARPFWVGGALYDGLDVDAPTTNGIAAWRLQATVPLGADVFFDDDAPSGSIEAVPAGGHLPVLPPFDVRHLVLPEVDVPERRDAYGFGTGQASVAAPDRVRWTEPLLVQVEERGQARAHRFVHLDPTRFLDPQRGPGHAFVGGTFAEPWHGIVATDPWLVPEPHRLRVSGPDGFDEALRTAADRGWDHYVVLDLPVGRGAYRLDSARLAAPALSAGPAGDPWTAGRTSAWFVHDPVHPGDLYAVGAPRSPPEPTEPQPMPPAPGSAEPSGPTDEGRDSPGLGLLVVLAATAAAVAWIRRRA